MAIENNPAAANRTRGIAFALIALVMNATQPVINNGRPGDLSNHLFTVMAVGLEFLMIIPVSVLEQRGMARPSWSIAGSKHAWRAHGGRFLAVGAIFAISTYMVIAGYDTMDSTTGAVILKMQPVSMMVIGALFLGEKVTWKHVIFTLVMLASVFHIATAGTWQLGTIGVGAVLLIVAPVMWNVGHALMKKLLVEGVITSPQLVFIRTAISTVILFIMYAFVSRWQDAWQIVDWRYLAFMLLMAVNYLILHVFWYKAIAKIDLVLGTAIIIPSPAITALLANTILGEMLHPYHFMGIIGSFVGLYGLLAMKVPEKRRASSVNDGTAEPRNQTPGTSIP